MRRFEQRTPVAYRAWRTGLGPVDEQQILWAEGATESNTAYDFSDIDGKFGSNTKYATEKLQARWGLGADGRVGSGTEAVRCLPCGSRRAPDPALRGPRSDRVGRVRHGHPHVRHPHRRRPGPPPELDGATVLVLNQAEGSLDPDSEVGTLTRSAPREST
ncbi:peptidoglycan-binding domain-containing protein [Streptomyces europaeiscabiei]|uniref:peptidoglycan-binding domain-containing protein n=1 Tax=Streptomyces europaeiscabiei TaxID=146819 RepID=UPI002E28DD44|nr:peptidoglycan-binding domain-containing protein [Streptomyces europaeiscabiei]